MTCSRGKNPKTRAKARRGSRILVVCEGKLTEPLYLNGLRQAHQIQREQIVVLGAGKTQATDPKSIVAYAVRLRNEAKRNGMPFDDVWCVFDRDEHESYEQAFRLAQDKKVKLACSNPCFELWILLHLQEYHAHIERNKILSVIRKHSALNDYEKGMPGLYVRLSKLAGEQGQETATRRAVALRQEHERKGRKAHSNPSTEMDLLVKAIRDSRSLPPGAGQSSQSRTAGPTPADFPKTRRPAKPTGSMGGKLL